VEPSLIIVGGVVAAVFVLTSVIVTTFLRSVDAGEILLASRGRNLHIYRGPCKALIVPIITQTRFIPAQAINVDIEITDQTADVDSTGRSAPVKVTVKASAIVSVGEDEAMVNTAANKFFSKSNAEQLSTLTDVLSSAGRRAINLLKHDQLFSVRSVAAAPGTTALVAAAPNALALAQRGEDDELAVIIKDACSRELMDIGLSFNSLNIKAVLSEVAEARRRESGARAKADADVVQAQEEQRARIAQLEAAQKVNDQEKALYMQIASNGASIAKAEADKQSAVRQQREAELNATQITQARADAEQNVINQEAEGRAQAARIRAIAQAEAEAIRIKAQALMEAGGAYLDLRRLEMAPELTAQVAGALSNSQFINFGTGGGSNNDHGAVTTGSDDVLRVVQTLMAAQIVSGRGLGDNNDAGPRRSGGSGATPSPNGPIAAPPTRR
jgi:flotillin